LNNLHVWVFVKWELKELKLGVKESQVPGIWKKIQNQRTATGSGYFKKTSQNCPISRKLGKEEPGRFLGGYFTFTIWDLGFKTSTDRLTELIDMIIKFSQNYLCKKNNSNLPSKIKFKSFFTTLIDPN
jgi:hypothetical protein